MTNSQRLAAVRLRLQQWLAQQSGAGGEASQNIRNESILIRDGFYCGRQFDAGTHRAVWFMEEDELKISTADGRWVCTLQGESLTPLAESSSEQPETEPLEVIPMASGISDSEADRRDDRQRNEPESGEKDRQGPEIRRAA